MYTYREGGDLWSVVLWLQERVQDVVLKQRDVVLNGSARHVACYIEVLSSVDCCWVLIREQSVYRC